MEKGSSLRRIAITGPESTGKSELAAALAERYRTVWVPEFAREYLEQIDRPYVFEDIVRIAQGQLAHERELMHQAHGLLFCDTELLVTKIWSEFKYGKCDPWITEQLEKQQYDLYLLCDIDLPWQMDPLREHPHQRRELFDLYEKALADRNWNYRIIRGTGALRTQCAVDLVNAMITGKA